MRIATALAVVLLLGSAPLVSGCSGGNAASGPPPNEALFDMTNDTYDAVDVYIGGAYIDTIQPNNTHEYDLGLGGVVYNIQIYESGDHNYQLNNDDVVFPAGVTTWDVYDNAPVVVVENQFTNGEAGAECAYVYVDGQSQVFDLTAGNRWTPPSDTRICPQETGFLLVDYGTHTVEAVGVTSGLSYSPDTGVYGGGTHVTYVFPTP